MRIELKPYHHHAYVRVLPNRGPSTREATPYGDSLAASGYEEKPVHDGSAAGSYEFLRIRA